MTRCKLYGTYRVFTALGFLGAMLTGCGDKEPAAAPPPPVTVMKVTAQQIPNVIELPGRVQAVRTAEVRARVDGIVQRRLYDEGSDVEAGKPLFAIDPSELRARLNAVEASLMRARATAANAAQDVARYEGLVAEQAISQQEYDAAVAAMRTAEADVAQAAAQVQSARLNLEYATVTTPIAGRVGRAEVTEGALVSAANGTLLTRVQQLNPIYVNFSQSSSDVLTIRHELASGALILPAAERGKVTLLLEDGSVHGSIGHLDFLDLSIDEATGTAALRAEFPNPERELLPGQFVRARIEAGVRSDGVLLPQRAVTVAKDGASVFVVGDDSIAVKRAVKLGDLQGGAWVILDGLKAGDTVILDGLQKVQAGKPVHMVESNVGASPAAQSNGKQPPTPERRVQPPGPDKSGTEKSRLPQPSTSATQ